jgi:hypothetical protein
MCGQRVTAARLAGFGAAKFEYMPPGRLVPEVMIESDHAVNFRSRQIQYVGDQRFGFAVDVTEFFLQGVEDW